MAPWLIPFLGILAIASMLVESFRQPEWIQVGPSGVGFREWFRSGHYCWTAVDFIQRDASFVYLRLRNGKAVRLPAIPTVPSCELMATLRRKQDVYARATMVPSSPPRPLLPRASH